MASDDKVEKATPKKGKGKGLLIIIILLVLIIIGGGVAAFLLLTSKKDNTEQAAPMAQPQAPAPVAPQPMAAPQAQPQMGNPAQPGPTQSYPSFVVNLADPGGSRYLKVTLTLELSTEKKFPEEVASKEPRIKDIIISVLSSKTFDEISTPKGKVALKQELLRRLNSIMSGGRITDIFITEFVIQ